MFWYLLRRLILVIPTLIGVAIAVFFLIRVMPGDVVVVKLRADGAAVSEETIEAERKRLGLDKPLYQQFADYMMRPAALDLGKSLWTGETVTKEIALRHRCPSRSPLWRA
jgi:peptide/nickel transport system permease protein